MKKTRLTCPVCNQQLDLARDEFKCVQVTMGSCRLRDVKSIRGATEGVVCFVHPDHLEGLVQMVRAGAYPPGSG
jgi:hypothetical protein